MITGRAPLNRYVTDDQWKTLAKALKGAGGLSTEGNRMHVDAMLDLMKSRMPWRDLDNRYGPWAAIYQKYVRWYETGILHGLVQALFSVGLTENWRETYTEISHGPSARNVKLRQLMAHIVVELRRHRDLPKKTKAKTAPKLAAPVGNSARDLIKEQEKQTKAAIRARRKTGEKTLSDIDWDIIQARVSGMEFGPQHDPRRMVNELMHVMRTNCPWNVMNPRMGSWSAIYARFNKWVADGTMRRLVKCLSDLGLTADWSQYLVRPVAGENPSLKEVIGGEAAIHVGKRAEVEKARKEAEKKAKKARKEKELVAKLLAKEAARKEKAKKAAKAKRAKAAKDAGAKVAAPKEAVTLSAAVKRPRGRPRKTETVVATPVRARSKPKVARGVLAAAAKRKPAARKAA